MNSPETTGLIDVSTSVDDAIGDGLAAAASAGVRVRGLHELADLDAVYRLYDSIWRPDPMNPPITTELLRALTKAGNYVSGAFDGDELIGACVGFFSAPTERAMHSHVAGVSGAARGRSVGFALKLHQRAWALQRGVESISWTFDPLIRRNAYFNVTKLAARPTEYLTNFYGFMQDGINGGDDSDRLLVRWQLDAPEVGAAATRRPTVTAVDRLPGATVALGFTDDGGPLVGAPATSGGSRAFGASGGSGTRGASGGRGGSGAIDAAGAAGGELASGITGAGRASVAGGGVVLVGVPADVEKLRQTDPGVAKAWRAALREVLGGLLADGARVTGFDRAGWYVLEQPVLKQSAVEQSVLEQSVLDDAEKGLA